MGLGSNITLKCVSRGGNPLPILVWTKNDLTLNTTFKVITHKPNVQSTVSILHLTNIKREDDAAELECLAHSQASHTPLVQKVSLEVIYSPVCSQETRLVGLSVGDEIDIPCSVSANPMDLTFHWFFNKTRELKVRNGGTLVQMSENLVSRALTLIRVRKCTRIVKT